jgi:hypothetical protein
MLLLQLLLLVLLLLLLLLLLQLLLVLLLLLLLRAHVPEMHTQRRGALQNWSQKLSAFAGIVLLVLPRLLLCATATRLVGGAVF